MLASLAHLLDRVGVTVLWTCVGLLVAIDAVAIMTVMATRSREIVNRWAKPVIAANVLLLGAGAGVPAAAFAAKFAIRTFAPSIEQRSHTVTTQIRATEALPARKLK
ncbi:MAG TPA: hypothetical protein VE967_10925 [Gemmatimonadaceae bacterium]|nr:hypothetical protein [Gemmatimonadaceae bacterium]